MFQINPHQGDGKVKGIGILGYFLCGIFIDLLITIFYRATAKGLVLVSSPLAFAIDIANFLVFYYIIRQWRWKYVIAYAVGTAFGNALGMAIL